MVSNLYDLKMDDDLASRIERAKSHKMSAQERIEQRVSFVYGSLSHDNNMTKDEVRKLVLKTEGIES